MTARLNVNIDHVATIREARKTVEPSVLEAARICEQAGAHGITVHLRGDRRHIQDRDIEELRAAVTTYLNVEMAATDEMVGIAIRVKPDAVSLVPEGPNEITTEGGLNVIGNFETVKGAIEKLKTAGIFVSIFIDPDTSQIDAAKRAGAEQVELCTTEYAEMTLKSSPPYAVGGPTGNTGGIVTPERGVAAASADGVVLSSSPSDVADEIERIHNAAVHARSIGLVVAAGHGLTTRNVVPLAQMPEIEEFNIGHHIISRAIFVGLEASVKEMLAAIA